MKGSYQLPPVYRGWTYGYDAGAPVTGRWRATRHGVGVCASTEEALKRLIDFKVAEYEAGPVTRNLGKPDPK
jgi:hypothetical protein